MADLLRMTISAAFATVDQASAPLARRERRGMLRLRLPDLPLEGAARPHSEQEDRHGEKAYTAEPCYQI